MRPGRRQAPPSRGRDAEQRACAYLESRGLRLVARNYRCRFGEIDLVMTHKGTLVFVEVRFRNTSDFGTPGETVDGRKQARLRASAERYLQEHPRDCKKPCRFDIVAMSGGADAPEWIQNAF